MRVHSTRLRAVLLSSAALRSVSLALTVGVALAPQAHAGAVTVNPVQTTFYGLTPANNPVTFGTGTNINTNVPPAVFGDANTSWTVTNNGTLAGYSGVDLLSTSTVTNAGRITGKNTIGVALAAGGSVTNQVGGVITGKVAAVFGGKFATVNNAGLMQVVNPADAVVALYAGGVVINQAGGTMSGGSLGVFAKGAAATVTNAGAVTGTGAGILLNAGGQIDNQSGGIISGGPVGSNATAGVSLQIGGVVTNESGGTITGGGAGVYTKTGQTTVTNAGLITSTTSGALSAAVSLDGGTVLNESGGTISGHGAGVYSKTVGTVTNAGMIQANAGVVLIGGGAVTNQSGGVITGYYAVYAKSGSATVTNAGSIAATTTKFGAIDLAVGGSVVNQSGGSIVGAAYGVRSTSAATVVNAGTISGGVASVLFTGAANMLTLQTGSTLNGDAIGSTASGATNALILQGSGVANNNFAHFDTLDVAGSGVWALNGVSTIGATTIDSGNLRVGDAAHPSAQLTSPITINAGGTLSGHGTVVGSVVNNGGVVSPGGSVGTLTIKGNLTQSPNSTLSLEVNPTTSSTLVVTGTANLAGSVVLVTDPGIYRKGTVYTFFSAGSTTGSFSSVTTTSGLQLTGANLLTGTGTVLAGSAPIMNATPNQMALIAGLVSVPVGASDFDTVANTAIGLPSGDPQNAALDMLGGEIDADFVTVGRDGARSFLGGIGDQLSAAGEARGGAGDDKDPWVRAYGNLGTVNGDGNAHGFDSTSGGAIMGASREWHGATVGAALSYGHTDLNLRGLDQKGSFDTGALALYGEHRMGVFFLDGAGSIAYDHGESTRTILFPGIARRTTGSFDGYAGAVLLSAGARLDGGDGFLFEPSLNLTYDHLQQNAFAEKGGGGADLLIGDKTQDALESTLQAKVSKPVVLANGNVLRTDIKVGWSHEWSPTGTSITEAFAAPGGDAFTLAGATPDKDRGIIGAGLAYDASKRLTYFGRYEATLGAHQSNNALTAGFKFGW